MEGRDTKAGAIGLPSILTSVRSRADRSWALGFDTRELRGEDAAGLMSLLQNEGYLVFAPNKMSADSLTLPEVQVDAGMSHKTPSQRLRATLYVLWEQRGKPGSFEEFYLTRMERIIDSVKSMLEPDEES